MIISCPARSGYLDYRAPDCKVFIQLTPDSANRLLDANPEARHPDLEIYLDLRCLRVDEEPLQQLPDYFPLTDPHFHRMTVDWGSWQVNGLSLYLIPTDGSPRAVCCVPRSYIEQAAGIRT